jgi:SAM-dependent methyltransferase
VIDDPADVAKQYATEANLRARQALWEEFEGEDTLLVLWRTITAWGPKEVLEVGGGQGELAERMQSELGAHVTFVDQSERMVELARARGIAEAHVGDVQQLPFPGASFDTVVAAWMLYHVADIDRGLSEIARVLKPGGALIAVTNSVRHLEELRALGAAGFPGFDAAFNRENGEESLRAHFAKVERYDNEVVAIVRDREKLVAWQASTQSPGPPIPDDIELPFLVHGRPTIFFAQT